MENNDIIEIVVPMPIVIITIHDEHRRRRRRPYITPQLAPKRCKECDKTFSDRRKYEKHKCKVYEKTCLHCGIEFSRAHDRRRHQNNCKYTKKEDMVVFSCPNCKRGFTRKDNLNRHVKSRCKAKQHAS